VAGDTSGVIRPHQALLLLIAAFLVLAIAGCGSSGQQVEPSDRDKAVDEAQAAFRQIQGSGQALSAGPCISESLPDLPDWVADVAHDPRQPIDDEPANQCQRYRDGQAGHFVELNVDGQLIRAE
jgi:predicted small lipoprotein YifL